MNGLPSLNRETQRWLRSARQTEIDVRPLARLQNESSEDRYASYMSRIICYLLRVEESSRNRSHDDDASESSEENGVDEVRNADSDDPNGDSDEEEDRAVKHADY